MPLIRQHGTGHTQHVPAEAVPFFPGWDVVDEPAPAAAKPARSPRTSSPTDEAGPTANTAGPVGPTTPKE